MISKAALATAEQLVARGTAFALLARLIGPDTSALADLSVIGEAREQLRRSGDQQALDCLDMAPTPIDAEELALRWVRWFDLGRVAPYEGSNVAESAGGITPRLADVAGFYRAFGMAAGRDRPDHVVAELEFVSLALLCEADALVNGEVDRRATAASATRSFLRDHLGGWIDLWSRRVASIEELSPWASVAAAVAALVKSEAARRNVVPLAPSPPISADAGVPESAEGVFECGQTWSGRSPDIERDLTC
jgi:nitrate reductase assembly molybdenum cofactor insertion protein NarJ